MSTITISVPESLKEYVEEQVRARGFGNVSEFFRSLVREDQRQQQDQELTNRLIEGLDSGVGAKATDEFWSEMRQEALKLIKKKNTA